MDLWLGEVLGITGVPTAYGVPYAAAHIERFMGSLKRECLNHFIFLSEDHLRRTVVAYVAYYNQGRPHQGIDGIPEFGPGLPRATCPAPGDGPIKVTAQPVLGAFTTTIGSPRSSGSPADLVAGPRGPDHSWSCPQCWILISTEPEASFTATS